MAVRSWGYWTEHKLDLLRSYLPRFTQAASAKASGTTVYLDLFAGSPSNTSRLTGGDIDGSPRIALQTKPGFSRVVLFELPSRARALEASLNRDFPGRDIRVHPGDCNDKLDGALEQLHNDNLGWAPTFAFLDQQGVDLRWETLEKLARHKRGSRFKTELWMLFADAQMARGLRVNDPADAEFAARTDALLGTTEWRAVYHARRQGDVSAEEFRDELLNWMRWRLENALGYGHTHALHMYNVSNVPIYSMVFATDNDAGNKIMSHLYNAAAKDQPKMRAWAAAQRKEDKRTKDGAAALFDLDPGMVVAKEVPSDRLYVHTPPTRPFGLLESGH